MAPVFIKILNSEAPVIKEFVINPSCKRKEEIITLSIIQVLPRDLSVIFIIDF